MTVKARKANRTKTDRWLIVCGLALLAGCEDTFTPASVVDRVRILGLRIDAPEICPLSEAACEAGTYRDRIQVSILAADDLGLVADGLHPDGPYLREGYELRWALCGYGFRGIFVDDPDCTTDDDASLERSAPLVELAAEDFLERLAGQPEPLAAAPPAEGQDFELKATVGAALRAADDGGEREWGVKQLTLSNRSAEAANVNPELSEVTLGGRRLAPAGDEALVEVETGYAYRIEWRIPERSWQRFEVRKPDGVVARKERPLLYFWSNGGSFSKAAHIDIWMATDEQSELYWRPPVEVPKEGQVVTLFFNLLDQRGGASWTWGRVRVVRGAALSPR